MSYNVWCRTSALRTGQPQGTTAEDGQALYDALYADPRQLEQFLHGMSAIQKQNFTLLAERFDFGRYQTLCDVGGALALLSRTIAARHPHIHCISLDLPQVQALATQHIAADGLSERIVASSGDFLEEPLPRADIIIMSNILHNWGLEQKKLLVRKAFDAAHTGGAFIAIQNTIDDARREGVFPLLMSLNMHVMLGDAGGYSAEEFRQWCSEAGFDRFDSLPLAGAMSALIAFRSA